MASIESIDIPAAHGRLEALLRLPDDANEACAWASVICHPHPLGQGTMHNKVVFTLAKAISNAGAPALRFNFRGVGRSTGVYDEGAGESEDVETAIAWLGQRFPRAGIIVAGFSFGAWVGLPVGCRNSRIHALIGAGVPTGTLPMAPLDTCAKPKFIVQGSRDEYGPPEPLALWFQGVSEPKSLLIIPDESHFFQRSLPILESAVLQWVQDLMAAGAD